jgi:alkanesulfonate monooxygenase SsuD/methylene tetrahydromethanopterin reductase-like flavin-dependent oxidoreductase (luciferase family)
MRYGIEIVTLGPLADPRRVVELATVAENSGFDLVAVWDHHGFVWGAPSADAIVVLSAIAQATARVRLLPAVLPLPKHPPHVLALQLAGLDILSDGRLIAGAGLGGVPEEFSAFGMPSDARERAARTDEALEVMSRLWSGEEVHHSGRHYPVHGVTLAPLPTQRPRPKIWIGGDSGAALRRAARWDGWTVGGTTQDGRMAKTPSEMAARIARLREAGAALGKGYEVAMSGVTHGPGAAEPEPYAEAGVTWWLESLSPSFGDFDELLRRVRAGPPA